MTATTATGNAMLETLLRGAAYTPPTATYIAFHTASPGATGNANEITAAAVPLYTRIDAALGAAIGTGFTAAASKASENAKDLLLPKNTGGADVTITHFSIWDHPTAGGARIYGSLVAPKIWRVGDECIVHIGDLDVTVT